jgi:hypothetical protein
MDIMFRKHAPGEGRGEGRIIDKIYWLLCGMVTSKQAEKQMFRSDIIFMMSRTGLSKKGAWLIPPSDDVTMLCGLLH